MNKNREKIYNLLKENPSWAFEKQEICKLLKLNPRVVHSSLNVLVKKGYIIHEFDGYIISKFFI